MHYHSKINKIFNIFVSRCLSPQSKGAIFREKMTKGITVVPFDPL